jgi:hypothetical protein
MLYYTNKFEMLLNNNRKPKILNTKKNYQYKCCTTLLKRYKY